MSKKRSKIVPAREIRNIIANFNTKSVITGHRRYAGSSKNESVYKMINWNWVECTDDNGQFVFIHPTEAFLYEQRIIL